jgi:hypothetical protein
VQTVVLAEFFLFLRTRPCDKAKRKARRHRKLRAEIMSSTAEQELEEHQTPDETVSKNATPCQVTSGVDVLKSAREQAVLRIAGT